MINSFLKVYPEFHNIFCFHSQVVLLQYMELRETMGSSQLRTFAQLTFLCSQQDLHSAQTGGRM